MPRVARIYTEEGVFHILTRGNNRQKVFKEESDYRIYKDMLTELKGEQPFRLYHYCLMGNHVHLIIETNERTELSKLMKRLNLYYYNNYKKKYGYIGHFWQDRFKSLLIAKDEYLLACGLYIERNPVRAKMVALPEKYPYSSYNYYAYGEGDEIVDRDPCYNELGRTDIERQRRYRGLMLDKEKGLNERIFSRLFLGTEGFMKEMEGRFKVRNIRLERGRPKKEVG